MERRFRVVLILLITSFLFGCGAQIVLEDSAGKHKLTYNSRSFKRQAKTSEDIQVLINNVAPTVKEMEENDDIVGMRAIRAAVNDRDFRELEYLIWQHRVDQL